MSSPIPAAPAPPSPEDILGPYYIGVVLNTFLYGILVLQTITYYQNYKRDRRWLRLFILYIFIAETVNTAVSVAMIYQPLISQFGTIKPMFLFPSLLPGQPIMETAVSVPVQFFYAWRIRIILQNWIAPVFICLTSLAALGGAWWTSFVVQNAINYLHKSDIDHPALVWSVSSAACDVLITVCLFFSLRGRKTGIKNTDDAVNRIVRTTVQTGALTMCFTALNVGLFVGLPNSTLSFVFDFALPKLYSNALVSTLNARSGAVTTEQPQRNVLFSTHATSSQHIVAPTSVVINKTYVRLYGLDVSKLAD
ncbi:hypothetical protein DFH08DRAFT_882538 [Mycena albidolilacea]|uniref:DUF6534 domain-containing protein n=1 Tax=Mycena albidolilacea TaxID=1033008 RepID=A0AAD7EKL8_9AGAR|nr:hypothetical protein DFH08DRAFT_882538 [Mycena albidolilacea]